MPRPRSREAHEKVLRAALDLIAENGIEGTSMDAIARLSGVSKATVYRHWPSKEALCLEATTPAADGIPDSGSEDPRANITEFLEGLARRRRPENLGRIWPNVITYAASNPRFARQWHARATAPHHEKLSGWIRQAMAAGQLRTDLDVDLAIDLLVGPVMHRRFMNTDVPSEVPLQVVDAFWRAFRAPTPDSGPGKTRSRKKPQA